MQGLLLYRSIYFQSKYQTDLYTCVHPTEHTVQIDTFWLEDQTKVCLNRGAICNPSSDNFYPWHKSTIGTKKEFTFIDFQVGSRSSTRVSEASEKNYIVSRVGTGKMKGLTFRSIQSLEPCDHSQKKKGSWDPESKSFSAKIRKVEARLWKLCKCYCATSSIPFAIMSCYCYCYCLETALQMLLCHTSSSHLLSCAVFRTKPVINRCKNSFSCQTLFGLIWQGQ